MSSISHQTISSYVDTDRMILSFLGPHDLVRCAGVCQTWHALTEEDDLWRHAIPEISTFVGKNLKQWVNCHVVTSDKTLLRNFEQFMTNLQWNEHGTFQCIFSFKPNCSIVTQFGCGSFPLNSNPDMCHICLSLDEQPEIDAPFYLTRDSSKLKLPEYYAIFYRRIYTLNYFFARGIDNKTTVEAMQNMMKKSTPSYLDKCLNLPQMGWKDLNHRTPAHIAKAAVAAHALGGNLSL